MEIFLTVMYWVLWALVWFSLFGCVLSLFGALNLPTDKSADLNYLTAFGILGIFSLLLLHTLGLA